MWLMTNPAGETVVPEHLFTCIDHVGVAVPDLDEAIAFYREKLGMRVLHEETNEEQGVREAMVGVGDSGSCIQLLAPLDERSTIAKFLDRSGPGLQQLAYRVTDVERLARVLVTRFLALEHVDLVLVDRHGLVGLRDLEGGEVLRRGVAGEDGVEDLFHGSSW